MQAELETLQGLAMKILSPCREDERLAAEDSLFQFLESSRSTPAVLHTLRSSQSTEVLFVLSESLAKSKLKEFGFGVAAPSTYEPSGSETDEFAVSSLFRDKKEVLDCTLEVLSQRSGELSSTVVSRHLI